MAFFSFFKKKTPVTRAIKTPAKTHVHTISRARGFDSVSSSDILGSWATNNSSADDLLRGHLATLRSQSRDLARNNPYVKRFKRMVKTNIIGSNGIRLQNKAVNSKNEQDTKLNNEIEHHFKRWSRNCDTTGKYSFRELCSLAVANTAIDGEVLIRKIKNRGEYGFELQLLEADHLVEMLNDSARNIVMGIEQDMYGKPIAYHLYKYHPSSTASALKQEIIRVPADEIIHLFLSDRISQSRGIPWVDVAIKNLKMLGKYEEAELVASRLAASKGGFYKTPVGESYESEDMNEFNEPIQEVTPGMYETLPSGWDFVPFDPKHPMTAFKDFSKAILRGIACGLDVSYAYLSNDLESVNYSSIRAGVLDERESWMLLQSWFIEKVCSEVYEEWLKMALLTGALPLPFSSFSRINRPFWMPKRWPWVDPQKDMNANLLAISGGLKSPSMVMAEMGFDIEEVYESIAKDKELREKYGITTATDAKILQMLADIESEED